MLDFESSPVQNDSPSVKQEVMQLSDQYSEFNDYCAFFCMASSSLLLNIETEINKSYAHGAVRFAYKLIERSQHIDDQLRHILQRL